MSYLVKIILLSLVTFLSVAQAENFNPGKVSCAAIEQTSDWHKFCSNKEIENFILIPNKIDNDISAMYQYLGSSNINLMANSFRKLIALQSAVRGYETIWSNIYQADKNYLHDFLTSEYIFSNAFAKKQSNQIMDLYNANSQNTMIIFFDFKYYVSGITQYSRYSLIFNFKTKKGLFLGRKLYVNN